MADVKVDFAYDLVTCSSRSLIARDTGRLDIRLSTAPKKLTMAPISHEIGLSHYPDEHHR